MNEDTIKLKELDKKEVELHNAIYDIHMEIARIVSDWQQIYIDSWDGSGEYEEGTHCINAPYEKFYGVEEFESGHKGTFVNFENGNQMKLEYHFTPEEINSIRKY